MEEQEEEVGGDGRGVAGGDVGVGAGREVEGEVERADHACGFVEGGGQSEAEEGVVARVAAGGRVQVGEEVERVVAAVDERRDVSASGRDEGVDGREVSLCGGVDGVVDGFAEADADVGPGASFVGGEVGEGLRGVEQCVVGVELERAEGLGDAV